MGKFFEKRKVKRVVGSTTRPRLVVFRSRWNIHGQVIDDVSGKTIASAYSQYLPETKGLPGRKVAAEVGKVLAERACSLGCKDVVFDRGRFKYAGRIKELAEGAREGGLNF